jgi:hypothetical protein|tara:strand:- start:9850 stop:10734 length:885 start_codon:yes stop_codon:yes gene_type:complete
MCAWKYPQEWFEDGDIIEPSDFRLNQQEYLGEVNGNLDNDNFYKKMFERDNFIQHSFNKVHYSGVIKNELPEGYFDPDSPYHAGGESDEYRPKDTVGEGMLFDMRNGGWMSKSTEEWNPLTSKRYLYPTYRPSVMPRVTFNAEEDGMILVDLTCNHEWLAPHEEMILGEYTEGSSMVDYGLYRPKGARFQFLNAYVQCIIYRVVCNGFTVCQTGPIGCEYASQPVYLCGALPISSGENVVQVEVRFVWYSPGTDKMLDGSSRNPTVTIVEGEDPAILTRTCAVDGLLIVNHRKR